MTSSPPQPGGKASPLMTPEVAVDEPVSLEVIRGVLLAGGQLDASAGKVLAACSVVGRCLRRGVTVDVMHSGRPQQVVTVDTADGQSIAAFLLALDPPGPRVVWRLTGDRLKIYPDRHGDLVVESAVYGPNDRVCCPSGSRVEVYRWSGGRLTRLTTQDHKGD